MYQNIYIYQDMRHIQIDFYLDFLLQSFKEFNHYLLAYKLIYVFLMRNVYNKWQSLQDVKNTKNLASNFKIIDQFGRNRKRKFVYNRAFAGRKCLWKIRGRISQFDKTNAQKGALAFTHRQGNLSEQAKQISGGSQQWRGKSGSNQVAVNASGRLT